MRRGRDLNKKDYAEEAGRLDNDILEDLCSRFCFAS